MANGKVLHVLSGERRTGSVGIAFLPQSQTGREKV